MIHKRIKQKNIISLEHLYHELLMIECINPQGHVSTARQFVFDKMKTYFEAEPCAQDGIQFGIN